MLVFRDGFIQIADFLDEIRQRDVVEAAEPAAILDPRDAQRCRYDRQRLVTPPIARSATACDSSRVLAFARPHVRQGSVEV